jgi:hypothetical protein
MSMQTHLPLILAIASSGCFVATDDTGVDDVGSETMATSSETDTVDADATNGSESSDLTTTESSDTTTSEACVDKQAALSQTTPNVMFVVDASGSMVSNTWDHDLNVMTPEVTRWFSLYSALELALGQSGATLQAGIQRFPSDAACPDATPNSSNCYNADACIVSPAPEAGVALDNTAAILSAIPGPNADNVQIAGGTPATYAFRSARTHLSQQAAGPSHVVLVLDGSANCVEGLPFPDFLETYDENLPIEVHDAFVVDQISTHVVGVEILDALVGQGNDGTPYANAYDELNELALMGGAPKNGGVDPEKFHAATDQQQLVDAFDVILAQAQDCSVDLGSTSIGLPDAGMLVEFELDGGPVPMVENCDGQNGWTWLAEGEVMAFCGFYCDEFKADATSFQLLYSCP